MNLDMEQKIWNFYRLGPTWEKELFQRNKESYTGVVLSAHIASYYSKFCTEFIGGLRKPYFIDPITYLFARDINHLRKYVKDNKSKRTVKDKDGNKKRGEIKLSYRKLLENCYGDSFGKIILDKNRSVNITDFDEGMSESFVKNVIDFQLNSVAKIPDKYKKYDKFVSDDKKQIFTNINQPCLLIPPYFYINSVSKTSWFEQNIKFIEITKSLYSNLKIPFYGMIFIGLEELNENQEYIIDRYKNLNLDGYLLWIDDFKGTSESKKLNLVKSFINKLYDGKNTIISMYGDAFSLILSQYGLKGFSCGICYGESKSVDLDIDVEGQIPPRYYLSRLKKKIQIETEARRIDLSSYPDLICDCRICLKIRDPLNQSDIATKEHFMLSRKAEIEKLSNNFSISYLQQEVKSAFEAYKDDILLSPVNYLQNWLNVLSK